METAALTKYSRGSKECNPAKRSPHILLPLRRGFRILSPVRTRTSTIFVLGLALASCSSWRVNHPQDTLKVNVPATWKEAGSGRNAKISTGWLTDFDDPAMTRIVREAIRSNQDLQAAAARLSAAKEETIVARARRLPSLDASARGSHSWLSNGDQPSTEISSYGLTLRAA